MKSKSRFEDTDPYTYSELCETYKVFSMPDNQRPYAWKAANVENLWEAIIENETNYFIGNVVALSPSEESDGALVIVDGQQRLTTLSLFLIAARNVIEKQNDTNSEAIKESLNLINHYLYWVNPADNSRTPRLIPGKDTLNSIYTDLLNNKKFTTEDIKNLQDSQKRYVLNLKQIETYVSKYLKKIDDFEVKTKLVGKISGAQLIAIVVKKENDIYDLFEGLNSTGLGLSIADLLKNAVLKSVTDSTSKNKIQSDWIEIENFFEDTKVSLFPKFLRHYWTANYKPVTTSRVFEEVKINKLKNKTSKQVKDFTNELLENAKFYIAVKFEDYDNYLSKIVRDKKVKFYLSKIRQISDLEQMDAVVLSLCNKKNVDRNYRPSLFATDLERLLNFSVLNKFSSINPSDYEGIFQRLCKIAREETNELEYQKKSGAEFKKLYALVSSAGEFSDAFSRKAKYGTSSKLIEYVLINLMKTRPGDRGIDVSDPNIEHILPQNPRKWNLTKEQVSEYVNLVGNLTILNELDNNDAGNETMAIKVKDVYAVSKFGFNQDICKLKSDFENNPESTIYSRGKKLGEEAYKTLKIL